MKYVLCFWSMAASNFLYQLATTRDWDKAAERTVFEGIAIVCVALFYRDGGPMTRAQLEQVRDVLAAANRDLGEHHNSRHPAPVDFPHFRCPVCSTEKFERIDVALALLDTELAKPEAREWRTRWSSWRGMEERISGSLDAARQAHPRNVVPLIHSRTPAGPWEPTE